MTNVRCRAMGVLAAMAILPASCSSSSPTSAPSSSPATLANSATSSTAAPAGTADVPAVADRDRARTVSLGWVRVARLARGGGRTLVIQS